MSNPFTSYCTSQIYMVCTGQATRTGNILKWERYKENTLKGKVLMIFQIGLILPGFRVENYLRQENTSALSLDIKQLFQLFRGQMARSSTTGKFVSCISLWRLLKQRRFLLRSQRIGADNRLKTSCHFQSLLYHAARVGYSLNFQFHHKSSTLTFLLLRNYK